MWIAGALPEKQQSTGAVINTYTMFRAPSMTEVSKPTIGTITHPYVVTITIDPAVFGRFRELLEHKPEVRILNTDLGNSDQWAICVGCASHAVADLIESAW